MSIRIHSEGAAGEVTGSKHVMQTEGGRVLVDCGAFQGKREECDIKNRKCLADPSGVDSMILTHGHYDHCGLIPLLVKRGFEGNVYSTPATRDLANLIMMDSAKIMARDQEYLSKQAAKKGEKFTWEPLYDEQDAVQATGQFVTVSYHRPVHVADGVELEFHDAGHILGSAMASFTVKSGTEKVNVVFTGDIGRNDKPIIRDPDKIPDPDYLVLESTYGNRLHESVDDAMQKLADVVNDVVRKKGKLVIPAFAVERTQELIYYFHMLVDQKRIPAIPIWIDSPMAINATSIFQIHPECFDEDIQAAFLRHHKNPFGFNGLNFSASVEDSKRLNEMPGPMVIVSADGMCEAGRIQHHLLNTLGNPANTVLIVGFMAANTLGRRIMEHAKVVKIHGQQIEVKASVKKINAFSAHADYGEIWNWMSGMDLKKLRRVFLVHGEPEALEFQRRFLLEKGVRDVAIIEPGQRYELA